MTAPRWLSEFQARFGAAIRTPLDRRSGTLRADVTRYDPALARDVLPGRLPSGAVRIAAYNRQYWFRLFGLMQSSFPLTARLLGYWTFNGFAEQFLLDRPPTHFSIDVAPDGFDSFLAAALPPAETALPGGARVPSAALLEAAHIDASWRAVFLAPAVTAYRPRAEEAASLLASRLVRSPTVAVFSERWPLLELRRTLADLPGEAPVPLPGELPAPQHWALVRKPAGIGQLALAPLEHRLFTLLAQRPIADALAELEAGCPAEERATIPAAAQRWLARSVELGFWSGREGPGAPL